VDIAPRLPVDDDARNVGVDRSQPIPGGVDDPAAGDGHPAPAESPVPLSRGGTPRLSDDDAQRILHVVDDFEEDQWRQGWDKDPALALIVGHRAGVSGDSGFERFTRKRIAIPGYLWRMSLQPSGLLKHTATGINISRDVRHDFQKVIGGHVFVGVMLSYEAYEVPQDVESLRKPANLFPERRRDEINIVMGYDIDDREYNAERRRFATTARSSGWTTDDQRQRELADLTGVTAIVRDRNIDTDGLGEMPYWLRQIARNLHHALEGPR
jgi:hypothetical protein